MRYLRYAPLGLLALTALVSGANASPGTTIRVSVPNLADQGTLGTEANSNTSGFGPAISSGGRYVAFRSAASNLVTGDTNGFRDVFVHDSQTGATERVSVDNGSNQGSADVDEPAISGDGRFVAFASLDANLAPLNPPESCWCVFVRDRQAGTTQRVDGLLAAAITQARPSINADGSVVAFAHTENLGASDTNGVVRDVFANDSGTITLVSATPIGGQGNDQSHSPSVSADGRFVAFNSRASNLVAGDTNNFCGGIGAHCPDVFVRDRQAGTTVRVSVASDGTQGNLQSGGDRDGLAISADGRFVAFESFASNLVPGDTNLTPDIFVHDLQAGTTERVSVDSAGNQANGFSRKPSISADGRFVAFESSATILVPGDTNSFRDIFVHDRQTGITARVSVDSAGNQANNDSLNPSISDDGRSVALWSNAANLVPSDTNGFNDIFVHEFDDADADGDWDPFDSDDDNDGMPDAYEDAHSCLSPLIDDAASDPDGDGFSNLVEFFVGTDPCDDCFPGYPPDIFPSAPEQKVLIDDVFFVAGRFNEGDGDTNYTRRAEIASQNGIIGIDDVFAVANRFNETTC